MWPNQKPKFQIYTIPRLSAMGNAAIETSLEVEISPSTKVNERKEILDALEELNRFLEMKMKITILSGGGGGQTFLEGPTTPVAPRKGDKK